MEGTDELLTKQLNIALTHQTWTKLVRLQRRTGIKPVDFGRQCIVEKLELYGVSDLTRKELNLIVEVKRLGLDLEQIIRTEISRVQAGSPKQP